MIGATGALRILENEKHPVITWGFAGYSNGEMKLNLIRELEKDQLRQDLPEMGPGDTVRVVVRVVEGGNVRSQPFEGTIIAMKGQGLTALSPSGGSPVMELASSVHSCCTLQG